MRDAFLLGAGFSRAVAPVMPTMDKLFKCLNSLVGTEDGVDPDVYRYASRFGKVEALLSYYAVRNPSDDYIEMLRKRIVTARLEEKIGSILGCREARIDLGSPRAGLGKKLVEKWKKRESHVLTANYDTVVEQLSRKLDDTQISTLYPIPVVPSPAIMGHNPSGTVISCQTLKLYKLHGSVSWYTSQGASNSDPIIGYVEFGPKFHPREKLLSGKRRLIAPPVHDKSTLLGHEQMLSLWHKAKSNALAPADRLYVIGYSLPETDIAMRTLLWESRRSQNRKIPLYLVDKDTTGNLFARYQEMLGDRYEVKDTYLGADAFERFVDDYARD